MTLLQVAGRDEALIAAHDLSMSKEPGEAVSGRACKAFLPVLWAHLEAEEKRGTPPGEVMIATISVCVSMWASTIACSAKNSDTAAMLANATGPAFIEGIERMVKHIEEQGIPVDPTRQAANSN